ncbi:MAG TPA: hypothetical protein VMX97_01020 [Hyphomicrobiaceae bacterium]|nr:hypothetical protein [Hyphomicrobiaceae bacterium]
MGLYPKAITEYLSVLAVPRGPDSKIYLVDTEQGDDDSSGDRWTKPLKTLTAAYAKCVADQHDVVLFLARDTADNPTATIAWDKDFTHLIGLGNALQGVGQRCRVVGTVANALTSVIDFGGKGNIVRNMQFGNEASANVDSEAVNLTGDRYEFTNCMIHGMVHATPAARAGSYSLGLTGAHENVFVGCWIGTDTIVRAAANGELMMCAGSSKNLFQHCRFASQSITAAKHMVAFVTSTTPMGLNTWEDCLFYNNSTNWAQDLTNAFVVTGAQATYYIDLCRCRLVGITGWSNVVTHVYSSDPASNAGFGVYVNPTT